MAVPGNVILRCSMCSCILGHALVARVRVSLAMDRVSPIHPLSPIHHPTYPLPIHHPTYPSPYLSPIHPLSVITYPIPDPSPIHHPTQHPLSITLPNTLYHIPYPSPYPLSTQSPVHPPYPLPTLSPIHPPYPLSIHPSSSKLDQGRPPGSMGK